MVDGIGTGQARPPPFVPRRIVGATLAVARARGDGDAGRHNPVLYAPSYRGIGVVEIRDAVLGESAVGLHLDDLQRMLADVGQAVSHATR